MFVNRAKCWAFIALLLSSRSFAVEPVPFNNVACEGDYQHHLQGVCADKKGAVYWSFTTDLVKTDRSGFGRNDVRNR